LFEPERLETVTRATRSSSETPKWLQVGNLRSHINSPLPKETSATPPKKLYLMILAALKLKYEVSSKSVQPKSSRRILRLRAKTRFNSIFKYIFAILVIFFKNINGSEHKYLKKLLLHKNSN
jgi:hypothetical protein